MRITSDLVWSHGTQGINPNGLWQLTLRGFKLGSLTNMGVTQNKFDAWDFSDNEIPRLEDFGRMTNLTQLLLANNRIRRISEDALESCPFIRSIVLTNNLISELKDVYLLLKNAPKLERLSLLNNPVTQRPHYRHFIISVAPATLCVLDFNRVLAKERADAQALFESPEGQGIMQQALSVMSADTVDHVLKGVKATLNEDGVYSVPTYAEETPDA